MSGKAGNRASGEAAVFRCMPIRRGFVASRFLTDPYPPRGEREQQTCMVFLSQNRPANSVAGLIG